MLQESMHRDEQRYGSKELETSHASLLGVCNWVIVEQFDDREHR